MKFDEQIKFNDALKCLLRDFSRMMRLTVKLKKVIKSTTKMTNSVLLDEALGTIITETCQTLNCDRV